MAGAIFRILRKDNGYDVEDYYGINKDFGNYDDFMMFKRKPKNETYGSSWILSCITPPTPSMVLTGEP